MSSVLTRIVVEFEPDAAPIAGRVRAGRDPARWFIGWTGLFVALRAAAGAHDADGQDEGHARAGKAARSQATAAATIESEEK